MSAFLGNIDFGQATPPTPANQGDMGPRFVQDPMTSDAPDTGFVETDHDPGDLRIRGYREPGIGGSASGGSVTTGDNMSQMS